MMSTLFALEIQILLISSTLALTTLPLKSGIGGAWATAEKLVSSWVTPKVWHMLTAKATADTYSATAKIRQWSFGICVRWCQQKKHRGWTQIDIPHLSITALWLTTKRTMSHILMIVRSSHFEVIECWKRWYGVIFHRLVAPTLDMSTPEVKMGAFISTTWMRL